MTQLTVVEKGEIFEKCKRDEFAGASLKMMRRLKFLLAAKLNISI